VEDGIWTGERDGLVGRDQILSTLQEMLDGGARTAVVTGIPGAGKTSLLGVVARSARVDGWEVLSLACRASDQDLAFGALIDLLSSAPGAEAALERVVRRVDYQPASDPLRLRLEVLDWVESLSERAPVLVLVDDAHWCDPSSLSVLGFVARRLAATRVSLIMSTRVDVAPELLADQPRVSLTPLADDQAKLLLRQAGVELGAVLLPSVVERAAGNPLALLELGRAAASGSDRERAPSSVESSFAREVSMLPAATRRLLLLAAACDGDLAAMGQVVEPTALVDDLASAEESRLVEVVGTTLRFRHPLARAAAYSAGTTAERTRAHTLLAAAYADDPGRQIWHRAEATLVPDESVASGLAEMAAQAQHRSAIIEAARLLTRAAELSPMRSDRDARMLQAALMNLGAGNFDWVTQVCGRLRDESDDPLVQVQASHMLAYALAQAGDQIKARTALVDVLEQLITVDPSHGWTSLTTLAVLIYRGGGDVQVVADWLERYDEADATPSPYSALVPAARAWVRLQISPLERPADVLELIRDSPVPDFPHALTASHEMLLGAAAWLLDEPEIALTRLGRSIAIMQRADATSEMTQTLMALSLVQFAIGDYDAADDSGRLVLDIAEARGDSYAMIDGREVRARVAGIRGDVETALDLCDQVLLDLRPGDSLSLEANVRVTMSWVRLAEHDAPGAWDQVRWLFREDGVARHEHISYRELGHYVATAVRAGAGAEVEPVLALAKQRLASSGKRHRLELARARALVAGEDAEPLHREAVVDPEAARWPFELANAQLEYGGWLRRRHRQTEARAQLQQALDLFERLGTPVGAEMARAELRAAGVVAGKPEESAWSELTGQERQVVRLAASGLTNPEIAASLYLSPRTVSTHLYNAFPKLGVTSRAQLRDVVMDR